MEKIKLIATDIDGTILRNDFSFSERLKEYIKFLKESGIYVILATGRMYSATKIIAEELSLDFPVICYQGAMARDIKSGDIIYEKNLNKDTVKEIIKWSRENEIHLNLYNNDLLYTEKDDYIIKKYASERYTKYEVTSFDNIDLERVHKLLAIDYTSADRVTNWRDEMSKRFPDTHIVKSTPYFCEFSNREGTKGLALSYLIKKMGIKKEEVLCIGDQNNDIELLEAGGTKVAMGNGTKELKEISDYITSTVEEDGFIKAIEHYRGRLCIE